MGNEDVPLPSIQSLLELKEEVNILKHCIPLYGNFSNNTNIYIELQIVHPIDFDLEVVPPSIFSNVVSKERTIRKRGIP